MAIRVPGSEPAEWLQLTLPWPPERLDRGRPGDGGDGHDGGDGPGDGNGHDRKGNGHHGEREAAPGPRPGNGPAVSDVIKEVGAGLASGSAAALGVAAAALAAATLAVSAALLAAAWAAVATAGLLAGAVSTAILAAAHGTIRGWEISAPYRRAARVGLAARARRAARWAWGAAVVTAVAAGRGTHVLARQAGRATAWSGRTTWTTAVTVAEGTRRAGRRRLFTVGPLRVTGAAAVLTVVVVLAGMWPARMAVGVLSAAVVAHGEPVTLPPLAQGSAVYDAAGQLVGVFHADDNRQLVALSAVSRSMVNAVIDTEDARFWSHGGVDLRAVLRAVRADLGSGAARQGGSTIAEQLVKNLLLANRPDDLRTKVQEAVLANRLEGRIGKRAVLRDYLNTVYFGEGAYGVQASAETYFAVPASRLDPEQSALLAGLIQDPNGYDPLRHAGAARARRHTVLGLMVAGRHLGARRAAALDPAPLPTTVHLPPSGHGYYLDAVQHELMADPRLGRTPQDRYRALFYGGLRIHTGLDPRLQSDAEQAVASGLPGGPMPLSAALAAIDPATGTVRAVVGGPSYKRSQFDAATASPGRQTGSAFKVFTLVAALEAGYSPNDLIDGSGPCVIPNPGGTPDPWRLANYESENFGTIDLTTATAHSVNCAFGRLAVMVGLDRVADAARRMGVTAPLAVVPSMTLGTNDVPPLQMASAYATLADNGVYHRPHFVTRVDGPDGRARLRADNAGVPAVSPQVAREAAAVLQQVVIQGTGKAAALPGRQVAGKTGTTEQFQDAWFVGFTPQLAAAVWMGDLAGEVPMLDIGGISVAGGTYPARIWNGFMGAALQPFPPEAFSAPDPGSVPPGVLLQQGRSRSSGPPAPGGAPGPGSSTQSTTWCWSSCGH